MLQSLLDFNNHVKVRTCINNNEYFTEINKIYLKRIRKCMHDHQHEYFMTGWKIFDGIMVFSRIDTGGVSPGRSTCKRK